MLMLAGRGFLDFAYLKVSVLELNPSKALFDFHLDGPVLHILKIAVLHSVLLNRLHAI